MLFLSLYEVLYQKQLTSCWTAKFFLTCCQISSVDNNSWLWRIRLRIFKKTTKWHHVILTCGSHISNSQEEKKPTKPQGTHITVFNPACSISSSALLYHFRINNRRRLTDSSWSAFKWAQEDLLHVVKQRKG